MRTLREAPPDSAGLEAAQAQLAVLEEELRKERRRSQELEEQIHRFELDAAVREKYAEENSDSAQEIMVAESECKRQVLCTSFVQRSGKARPHPSTEWVQCRCSCAA